MNDIQEFKEKLQESFRNQMIRHLALVKVLQEKGILTQEEYDRSLLQSTSLFDQCFAEVLDEEKNKEEEP